VDEVSSVTASGVEHAHAGTDVPAQYLVEDVDINLPELFLNGQSHRCTFSIDQTLTFMYSR
jgi:hypothetical protein